MGFNSSGSFQWALTKRASLGGTGWALVEPKYLSVWLLTFSDHFPSLFQEAVSTLRILNMFNIHIYIDSLGKNLALDLFTTMPTACWVTL